MGKIPAPWHIQAMNDPVTGPPSALLTALRKILRPLIRLLLNFGITFPAFTRLVKELFVDVAESDFQLPNKEPTDSRISLISGVHRKDVKRLRAERGEATNEPPEAVSRGTQVIATWVSEKRYQDEDGKPKRLPLWPKGSRKLSFEELVISVFRQDLRPRVVLEELERLGIVRVHDDETVELLVEAFVPADGLEEKAHYFGQNLRDHIAAAARNLNGERPPYLERSVTYHELTDEDVEELRKLSESAAMEALKQVNQIAARMKRRNQNNPEATRRINFGTFFYSPDRDGPDDEDTE